MNRVPRAVALSGLLALTVLLAVGALAAGKVWVPLSAWTDHSDPRWPIIVGLRLPRLWLGLLVGAALGMSGAAMQGYTRNPLADPGALGVSSLAALGAVMTLYFGAAATQPWVMAAAGMAGALAAVVLLQVLAGEGSSILTFLLAGVVLQTLGGAGVAVALSLAPDPWAASTIIDWLMGSLADRSAADVWMAAPFVGAGCALLLTTGRALDALTLGETGARSLGVDLGSVRWRVAVGVALAAGASVAVTGVIGFVGLIVPHLLRPLLGSRPGALLIPSAIGGAALTLAADIAVRLTPGAVELKLGVAMAMLGCPFFLVLLATMRRRIA